MSIDTQVRLIGDWANVQRREQLQKTLEGFKSQEGNKIEVVVQRELPVQANYNHNDDDDVVQFCTPPMTPRDKQVQEVGSAAASTVPSNQITPQKLLRERKIYIETHIRETGSPVRLVSFDVERASKYYDSLEN